MALLLRYAIRSHVGLIREGNEDSGYAGPRLLAIADGMGGAAAGELASAVVMATVARLDQAGGGPDPQTLGGATEQTLQISQHDLAAMEAGISPADQPGLAEPDLAVLGGAVVAANERLRAIVVERPELEGMGTTLTAMLWSGGRFGMVHVGDSRAYRLRDGLLEQMTADHTWVQRLIDEGRITEEEAGHHPQRSLLMRVLDGRSQVEADIGTFDAHSGDRYLLCSDGLSGFVSQETLAETLAAYPDPQQAVDALIELALRAGGPDNITCIVADTLDDGGSVGSGPNEATQMIGSVTPVVVGAASEGVDRLPRFTTAQPAPPPPDEFGQNHPAGRAARLRNRRGGAPVPAAAPAVPAAPAPPAPAPQQAAPVSQHPGAVATDAGYVDPSAVTAELETVPGQRGEPPSRRRPGGAPPPPGAPAPAAHPEPRSRGRKGMVISGVTVIVLAGAATGAYLYSRGQYYTKTSGDAQGGEKVVLYQGMTELSFLSRQLDTPDLPVRQIPLAMRGDATATRTYSSENEAKSYLATVRTAVDTCVNYWKTQAAAGAATNPAAPVPTTPASSVPPPVKSGDDIPSGGPTGAADGTSNNGGAALPSTSPAGDGSLSSDFQSPGSSDTAVLAPSASGPTTSPEPQKELAQYCAGTNG